jgi:hypothetical protein
MMMRIIQFKFINVPNQQPEGQLHKQHNIQTQIKSQKVNYTNSTTYKHKSTARRTITQTAQHTNTNQQPEGQLQKQHNIQTQITTDNIQNKNITNTTKQINKQTITIIIVIIIIIIIIIS